MSKISRSTMLSMLARIVLTFVFVFGQTAWAGQGQNAKDRAGSSGTPKSQQGQSYPSTGAMPKAQPAEGESGPPQGLPTAETSQPGGDHEGIKVHGHWTIEVRNPNGALVTHREFENSIQQGALALAGILGRQSSPGFWFINLSASPDCGNNGGAAASPSPVCTIVEPISNLASLSNRSNTLAVTVTNSGASLTLTGTIAAPFSLQVTAVQTALQLCNATTPSTTCATGQGISGNAFTSMNLTTPLAVSAGQTIAVTVVISFS